jgi:hypothetical protein
VPSGPGAHQDRKLDLAAGNRGAFGDQLGLDRVAARLRGCSRGATDQCQE